MILISCLSATQGQDQGQPPIVQLSRKVPRSKVILAQEKF